MAEGTVSRIKAKLDDLRERYPFVDHVLDMVAHYGKVQGSVLAGAATYFGFLSFFPLLAVAFAVVGYVSIYFPEARDSLAQAIEQVFPGIVSSTGEPGTISLQQIESAKATAGVIGFAGVLYSGLNWVSGLRTALESVFEVPAAEKRNFVVGKGIDLMALGAIGVILVLSVSVTGVVKGAADTMLGWVGLASSPIGAPLIWVVAAVLGLAASTLLLFVMFKLLGSPELPNSALWRGALLGAVGFEVLKLIVVNVIGGVGGSAFAPLAIAVTLVVWINYFSRLVIYGASWAVTSQEARPAAARLTHRSEAAVAVAALADSKSQSPIGVVSSSVDATNRDGDGARPRFDAGSAMLGAASGYVAALLTRRPPRD